MSVTTRQLDDFDLDIRIIAPAPSGQPREVVHFGTQGGYTCLTPTACDSYTCPPPTSPCPSYSCNGTCDQSSHCPCIPAGR